MKVAILCGLLLAACSGAAATRPADVAAEYRAEWGKRAEAAEKAGKMVIPGAEGWLFFRGELRYLSVGRFWGEDAAKVSRAKKAENADPLPAIVDFKEQLEKLGIRLVVVPVPAKATVYPEASVGRATGLPGEPVQTDVYQQAFYKLLADNGVEVLDLAPEFLRHRSDASPPYCKQDSHWSGTGCELAAGLIAGKIKAAGWLKDVPTRKFDSEYRTQAISGDLWKDLGDEKLAKEELRLRFVGVKAADGSLRSVETDVGSPVVLLGDSHNLVFHAGEDMHAVGAGLADQLGIELGMAVDLEAVRGSGATPARVNFIRKARADAGYLKGKKVVIWCFSVREFTESDGWVKLPIVKN